MFDLANPPRPSRFYNILQTSLTSTDDTIRSMIEHFWMVSNQEQKDDFLANVVWGENGNIAVKLFYIADAESILLNTSTVSIPFKTSYYGETSALLYALQYGKYQSALYLIEWAQQESIFQHNFKPLLRLLGGTSHKEYYEKLEAALGRLPTTNSLAMSVKDQLLNIHKHLKAAAQHHAAQTAPAAATHPVTVADNVPDIAISLNFKPFLVIFPGFKSFQEIEPDTMSKILTEGAPLDFFEPERQQTRYSPI